MYFHNKLMQYEYNFPILKKIVLQNFFFNQLI